MAKETIEAIRQAELAAEQTEKDAAGQAEDIVAKAQQTAKDTIATLTQQAKSVAAQAAKQAGKQGEDMAAAALREAEQELTALRETAKEKTPGAVARVLSELI